MADDLAALVQRTLRPIPDYPKPGILFQDITPVLRDGAALPARGRGHGGAVRRAPASPTCSASRRAASSSAAPSPRRSAPASFRPGSPGKLPWESLRESYDLEYGQDALEAHSDSWTRGRDVLVVDDVLATGGTARAAGQLARALGADLAGWTFLLEIEALGGRGKLTGSASHTVTRV